MQHSDWFPSRWEANGMGNTQSARVASSVNNDMNYTTTTRVQGKFTRSSF